MTILDLFQKKQRISNHKQYRGETRVSLIDRYCGLYQEIYFCELLSIERKRSERSRKPFVMMLVELKEFDDGFERHQVAKKICETLSSVVRDTDIKGWYKYGAAIGVIFTEMVVKEKNLKRAHKQLIDKCGGSLRIGLDEEEFEKIVVTWHVFPSQFDIDVSDESEFIKVYPDVVALRAKRRSTFLTKRTIDIFGSLFLIAFLSPLFLCIAVLIKFSSDGPVLFKQERVGLFGKRFRFLKFRSMFVGNDPAAHKEFVTNLICGKKGTAEGNDNTHQQETYKITRDPRVTPFGYFLRKSSLDELPQFFNVLWGDMSLVGPRPPIPYECENYAIWHRRRVLEMKPGITGLWQVRGRSSTTFDEMVRMDIQYTREWSLWLDVKILLKTPWVVLTGKGAY